MSLHSIKIHIIFALFIGAILPACKKDYSLENRKPVGIGINNAYVLKANYVSHSGSDLFIDLDIGVVGSGDAIDMTSIPDSAFKNKLFGSHELIIESIERLQMSEATNYSNLLAIDMSGSWDDIDLFNLRTRAFNKTVIETLSNSSNEIALGRFERNEGAFVETRNDLDPYHLPYEDYGKILFNFYYQTGTTSNVYDAIEEYLEYANANSNHQNKNLTVVIRNDPDFQNSVSVSNLINTAVSYGIKINLIVIGGSGVNWSLYSLASKTGGFLNVIGNTSLFSMTLAGFMDKGTPMLGSIDRLLSRNVFVYKLHLKLKINSGSWTTGMSVYDYYETNLNYSDGSNQLNNYLPFYVKIP